MIIKIIIKIFAVIGMICTGGSVLVSISLMWHGWREKHEQH